MAQGDAGMLITEGWVGGMRKHPIGRVDQLEDRYLGMVEAPSSNLGTSTTKFSLLTFTVDEPGIALPSLRSVQCSASARLLYNSTIINR